MYLRRLTSSVKAISFILALLAALQASTSMAATTKDIPENFDAYWSGASDAYEKFKSCLPFATKKSFKAQVLAVPEDATAQIRNSNLNKVENYVLVRGDVFMCVHLDSRKKAIIPTNFFQGTIYFAAQPDEDRKKLYTDLSRQLTQYGLAHALIVMKNGNATHISYMFDADLPTRVYFSATHLKPGEYDIKDFKSVYQIPDSSMTVSGYGGQRNNKLLIQGIQASRPLTGEFLAIDGNKKTGLFAFEGTKWAMKDKASINFESDGKLTFTPAKGSAISGDWKIENNALYFHYGRIYISAVLGEDGDTLVAEGRSLLPPGFVLEGNNKEMRWKSNWTRSGA